MKIENQVCTLEQAKKLKELGVTRVGCENEKGFYYWTGGEPKDELYYEDAWPSTESATAAFTVAELGEMLPNENGVRATGSHYNDHMGLWFAQSHMWADDTENEEDQILNPVIENEEEGETEAEVRAELLIWLLENKLVTAEEVNDRLTD